MHHDPSLPPEFRGVFGPRRQAWYDERAAARARRSGEIAIQGATGDSEAQRVSILKYARSRRLADMHAASAQRNERDAKQFDATGMIDDAGPMPDEFAADGVETVDQAEFAQVAGADDNPEVQAGRRRQKASQMYSRASATADAGMRDRLIRLAALLRESADLIESGERPIKNGGESCLR